jgi:hypothetical protein
MHTRSRDGKPMTKRQRRVEVMRRARVRVVLNPCGRWMSKAVV